MSTVYDFKVTATDDTVVSLSDYSDKVLLIVNVASKCGLTPQYEGLETLHRAEHDMGLRVLAFPCNQFLEQEPGSDAEIQDFCRTAYDVTFPVFSKVDINGPDAHPLFQFLRAEAPGDFGPHYDAFFHAISKIRPHGEPDDVKWNFTKFLVGRDGRVIKRYEPPTSPVDIRDDLQQYL